MNLMTQLIRLTVPICVWMSAFMHWNHQPNRPPKIRNRPLRAPPWRKSAMSCASSSGRRRARQDKKSRERIRRLERKDFGIRSLSGVKTTAPKGSTKIHPLLHRNLRQRTISNQIPSSPRSQSFRCHTQTHSRQRVCDRLQPLIPCLRFS